ncbi:MAG: STAS domain-containing protein [Halioglobus sp.]
MNKPEKLSLTVLDNQLRVQGVLNFTTAAGMSQTIDECIGAVSKSFTVDLSGLEYFNSAVLLLMLDCMRLSQKSNKSCQFLGATPGLRNMLKMASLEKLLDGNHGPVTSKSPAP